MLRRWWPIAALLVFQLTALALMPMRSASARIDGRRISLRARAVDPSDPVAGRFVVLRYDVEFQAFEPGMRPLEGALVYLTVQRSSPVWVAAGVTDEPLPPSADRLSLRARWRRNRAAIENAGRLYMSEELCDEADELLRETPEGGIVDLAVDASGNATPLHVRIAWRTFP